MNRNLSYNYLIQPIPASLNQGFSVNITYNNFQCPLPTWCDERPIGDGACTPCNNNCPTSTIFTSPTNNVNNDCCTAESACSIDTAFSKVNWMSNAESLVLLPGVYEITSNLQVSVPGITIEAQDSINRPILRATSSFHKSILTLNSTRTTLIGIIFEENISQNGALYVNATVTNTQVMIYNCAFRGNVVDCSLSDCTGAVYVDSHTKSALITILNSEFLDNSITTSQLIGIGGAAVHLKQNSNLVIISCSFINNRVEALSSSSGSLALNSSGGAIYVSDPGFVTIINSTFHNNVVSS
ncbi:MAG: hypothetical protein Q8M03_05610, partial [Legionella sp.]|nr:hypothetical protein [Legionella sp.]